MAVTALLHIKTAMRNGITYLKNTYCDTPFKIADITENKSNGTLHLMIMSSSPGILDSDDYQIKIELEENCILDMQTQSYQRLYHMKTGALQQLHVHLQKGATFTFLPHPSVPHEAASFVTKNKFYLSDNCTLISGEVLTCGRKLNGEVFLFTKYHSITEVYVNDKLIVKENLLIKPKEINVNAIGQLEGFTHQASLIYLNEAADIKALLKIINEFLLTIKDIEFGVSKTPENGLVLRILGHKAEQLHDALKAIATMLETTNTSILKMHNQH